MCAVHCVFMFFFFSFFRWQQLPISSPSVCVPEDVIPFDGQQLPDEKVKGYRIERFDNTCTKKKEGWIKWKCVHSSCALIDGTAVVMLEKSPFLLECRDYLCSPPPVHS